MLCDLCRQTSSLCFGKHWRIWLASEVPRYSMRINYSMYISCKSVMEVSFSQNTRVPSQLSVCKCPIHSRKCGDFQHSGTFALSEVEAGCMSREPSLHFIPGKRQSHQHSAGAIICAQGWGSQYLASAFHSEERESCFSETTLTHMITSLTPPPTAPRDTVAFCHQIRQPSAMEWNDTGATVQTGAEVTEIQGCRTE